MNISKHLTLFLLSLFLLPFFVGCQVGLEPQPDLSFGSRKSALNILGSGYYGQGIRYTTARSDFDRDGSPELVYLRTKGEYRYSNSKTKLEVFSQNGRFQLLASKEIQAQTLDGRPRLDASGAAYTESRNFDRLPSMALGALDNTRDKQDEIVLAYDNNGRVLVEVYRLDLQAGQLRRWAVKELGMPGTCDAWGCRPSVTVGDFDRDGKMDVAVAFENGVKRPMIVVYGFVVRADGSAVLQEKVRRELGLEKNCAYWGTSNWRWRYARGCKVKVAAMKDYENGKPLHRLVMTHESGEGQVVVQVFDLQKKDAGNTLEVLAERRFGHIGQRRRGRQYFAHVTVGNYYGSIREEIAVLFVDDVKRLRLFLFSFEGGRLKDFPCKADRCRRKWNILYPDHGTYRLMNIPGKHFDSIGVQYRGVDVFWKLSTIERLTIKGGNLEERRLVLMSQKHQYTRQEKVFGGPLWSLQKTTLLSPLAKGDDVDHFLFCELPTSGISCDAKAPEPPKDPTPKPPTDSSSDSSSQPQTGKTIVTFRVRDGRRPCEFFVTADPAFYPGTISKIVVKGSSLRYLSTLRKDDLAAVDLGRVHTQDVTVNNYNGKRAAGSWKLIAFGRVTRNGRPNQVDNTCRNVGHLTAEIHWRR
jgi:hypothetical protein